MDMRWKARKERQWRNHAGRCEACLACVVDGQRWSDFLLVLKVVLEADARVRLQGGLVLHEATRHHQCLRIDKRCFVACGSPAAFCTSAHQA
ncbi:hypothetical protein [Xanthomonas arboricola]|uniref:hypothetical protein n=1 Tax=Xanthomonas arboricola TaxID=56448 RepID=UPI001C6161E8|nr:hypothetical protein [Xanthomonas arboricola]